MQCTRALRAAGKPAPKSGCAVCGSVITGRCQHPDFRQEVEPAEIGVSAVDVCAEERRVPMQGDGPHWIARPPLPTHPPGTVLWSEHLLIYEAYVAKWGRCQTAERLAERGGFSYFEATELLGRKPESWRPRRIEGGG